ncbi:CehA/McbA family metallohydrolase [Kosmotoga olearia]|uniref:PHP domain protein n=1 Tax=Kosmotoga olearia (strain ATCC BAA-1733 / DSM 21960 / TBF 19.5.1) TaxID=521045 RepID=C5CIJ8_KOSOT|nr:CehA/McbA family metallohydrolase [Kosmotoga olearia]ACR79861.1 PHP domain protein [Kosmotoga olearia TBF 19.5.1]
MKKTVFLLVVALLISVIALAQFENFNLYFGNLHSHTSYSDGKGTPEIAYNYARNAGHLDFHAVTDHAHYFEQELMDGRDKFDAMKEAARNASDENFLAIAGFEWTATGWGHINIFETPDWTDRNESPNLDVLYKWIVERKALAQFNHPISTFGIFDDFKYDPRADEYINLVEVGNGNWSLGDTISPEMFNAVRLAFAKGWHLGTAVGQDNHKPNWGTANDSRTAVYSPSLKWEDFYESLMARRTYGTEDKDVVVEFSGNGYPLGSIIYDAKEVELKIKVKESDDDIISKVVLYNKTGIYRVFDVNSNSFEHVEKISPDTGYDYYFLYVLEADGEEVVSTPIWVQSSSKTYLLNPALYPSNVKPGEIVKAKFQLVNANETEKSLHVAIKASTGNILSEETYTLNGMTSREFVIEFAPESVEDSPIGFYVNDELYYKVDLTIRSGESMNIVIDKTHDNHGMKNREILKATLDAAGNKVTEAERILKPTNFTNTDVFILPLPGTEGYFETVKILMPPHAKMIENFVKSGGTLIVLGNGVELSDKILGSYNSLLKLLGLPVQFGDVNSSEVEEISGIYFDGYREIEGAGTYYEKAVGKGKVILFAGDPFTDAVIEKNGELLKELFGVEDIIAPEVTTLPVVLIDVAHGNDYSREKLNDFSAAIDSWGYLSKFSYGKLTEDVLKEVSLLIIMDGTGFTDEEYRAVKKFFENGGRLILTGKSDFRNGSHPQAMNKFLELIGSSIRINDDQIIDRTDNYGAYYKVEIKTFPDSPLELTEIRKLDVYSGCSLIVKGKDVLIFATGDDDTESVDQDGRGDAVRVDRVIFAAGEVIGNSKVAVLGKAVFSDYDFKHPKNDNYKFTKALIDWLMK